MSTKIAPEGTPPCFALILSHLDEINFRLKELTEVNERLKCLEKNFVDQQTLRLQRMKNNCIQVKPFEVWEPTKPPAGHVPTQSATHKPDGTPRTLEEHLAFLKEKDDYYKSRIKNLKE